jgi:uncharacterized membrane protein YedE/YeeE
MNLVALAVGLAFGVAIAGARLHEYDVIHKMLLLQEPDVFLLMGSAVAVAAPTLVLLRRVGWQTPFGGPLRVARAPVERNNVLGAVVFGTGWAIAGTCPGPAIAMVATGSLPGLFVMAGIITGATLYGTVARIPRWRPVSPRESAALNLSC